MKTTPGQPAIPTGLPYDASVIDDPRRVPVTSGQAVANVSDIPAPATPTPSASHTCDGLLIQSFPPLGFVVGASEHNFMAGKWEAEMQRIERELEEANRMYTDLLERSNSTWDKCRALITKAGRMAEALRWYLRRRAPISTMETIEAEAALSDWDARAATTKGEERT